MFVLLALFFFSRGIIVLQCCVGFCCTTMQISHNYIYIIMYVCVTHTYIYIYTHTNIYIGLQCRRPGFDPWVGKIPWRKEWQPTAIFLPGEFHEQRSLAGYSPGACKEWEPTEQLTLSLSSPPCGASHPHSHPTLVD